MRKGFWLSAAVVAAALTALACGGGESTPGRPGSPGAGNAAAVIPTVTLGTPITFTDNGAEASVVVTAVDAKAKSTNQFDTNERGQFVAISVEATAVRGASDVGPSNFRFIGNTGDVFQAEILIAGIKPALDAMTEIQEGQKKTGKVVFDCEPAKITGGKIQLSDDLGNPVGYWTF